MRTENTGSNLVRAFLLAGLLGLQASAQGTWDDSPAVQAAQAVIQKNLKAYESPGLSFVFVEGERQAWSGAFGSADRERHLAASDETLFELGSISKLFTCVAVMQLREQGKLDLDRPYLAYVPEFAVQSRFPTGQEAITVRMLMTHHSGLVTDDDPWETTHPERYFYRALLDHLKGTNLLFPPGQRWHYSSFGVNLLGLLVERVSGLDFNAYMKQRILGPLEMPHASFDIRELPQERIAAAYNYHPAWDSIPKDEIRPAGSLRAPLPEAGHFVSMMLEGGTYKGRRLLEPGSVAEMLRIQDDGNPLDQGNYMGLGFRAWYETLRAEGAAPLPIFGHGGVARHRSMLVLVPAWKVGLVAAVNDLNARTALLWDPGEALLRGIFAQHGERYDWVKPLPGTAGKPQRREGLAGDYASIYGLRSLDWTGDGSLSLSRPGSEARTALDLLADGTFLLDGRREGPRVLSLEADGLVVRSAGQVADRWQKLPPVDDPRRWEGHQGIYEPADGESLARTGIPELALSRENGRWLVKGVDADALGRAHAGALFPLLPLDDTTAQVANGALSGWFGYVFAFGTSGGVPALLLKSAVGTASYRLKR